MAPPNLLGGTSALFLAEATSTTTENEKAGLKHRSTTHSTYAPPKTGPSSAPSTTANGEKYYQWEIVWRNCFGFVYLHTGMIYGLYLLIFYAKGSTALWTLLIALLSGLGITAGAHRLWAHRSYKARWPMRLLLAIFQTMAFQNHIYEWVRDHRVHHKFTDTDADPHNSNRGFFFSHMGWLMIRKHPDVRNKGKAVDMSDLERDPIVVWQMRTYLLTMPIMCFVFPTLVPWYYWGEDIYISWYVATIMRYTLTLNGTWLVNSAAHIWGTKPYDKSISPTNNLSVAMLAFGEGWHNYHHVFPWDYKAAELGNYRANISTGFIDLCAKLGLAYDLKTVTVDMVKKRISRTGDGTHMWAPKSQEDDQTGEQTQHRHSHHHHSHESHVWGWDDKDLEDEDKKEAFIYNKVDE